MVRYTWKPCSICGKTSKGVWSFWDVICILFDTSFRGIEKNQANGKDIFNISENDNDNQSKYYETKILRKIFTKDWQNLDPLSKNFLEEKELNSKKKLFSFDMSQKCYEIINTS